MPQKSLKHILATPTGYRAQIRIHGVLHRQRFPRHTPVRDIREWLLKTELRYRRPGVKRTGIFRDDAAVYLESVKAMPTFGERQQHIDEWVSVFGDIRRSQVTPDLIAAQLQRWRTEPRIVTYQRRGTATATRTTTLTLSASAVNKRRTALMHLYSVLDGKAAWNPVKDVPKFREPSPLPRSIPYDVLADVWAAMPDTASRARLQVIAYTGLPHAQLATVKPEHIDWTGRTLLVHGRQKGAGTPARVVPLTPDAIKALKAMRKHEAWGPFSASGLRKAFQQACAKVPALKPVAATLTPYDLRHSFGTEVYRASGDIRATQILMAHSSPTLTHRYTLAAVDPRVAEALKRFGKK